VGLDRPGGGLGVQRVGLAAPAPGGPVGAVDLDHDLPMAAQKAGQGGAEGAGALDAPGVGLAEALRPVQQLGVAGRRGGDAGGVQAPAEGVLGDGDVDVGVGIDPNGDLGGCWLWHRGDGRPPCGVGMDGTHRPGGRTRLRWVCGDRLL